MIFNNKIFDELFSNICNDYIKNLTDNSETYTDASVNGDKIDLSTQEGHDKFVNALNELRDNSLFSAFGMDKFVNKEIDDAISAADNILIESHKQLKDEASKELPAKPSDSLNETMKTKIGNITDEYLNTVIYPHCNIADDKKNDIRGALYEFASWIYTR